LLNRIKSVEGQQRLKYLDQFVKYYALYMMDNDWNRLKIMLKNSQDEETEMEQKM